MLLLAVVDVAATIPACFADVSLLQLGLSAPEFIDRVAVNKFDFRGLSTSKFSGNVPGSQKNVRMPEVQAMKALWSDTNLGRWIPMLSDVSSSRSHTPNPGSPTPVARYHGCAIVRRDRIHRTQAAPLLRLVIMGVQSSMFVRVCGVDRVIVRMRPSHTPAARRSWCREPAYKADQ